jgi:hypothetical protein
MRTLLVSAGVMMLIFALAACRGDSSREGPALSSEVQVLSLVVERGQDKIKGLQVVCVPYAESPNNLSGVFTAIGYVEDLSGRRLSSQELLLGESTWTNFHVDTVAVLGNDRLQLLCQGWSASTFAVLFDWDGEAFHVLYRAREGEGRVWVDLHQFGSETVYLTEWTDGASRPRVLIWKEGAFVPEQGGASIFESIGGRGEP